MMESIIVCAYIDHYLRQKYLPNNFFFFYSEVVHVKYIAQCLAQNKCSINICHFCCLRSYWFITKFAEVRFFFSHIPKAPRSEREKE